MLETESANRERRIGSSRMGPTQMILDRILIGKIKDTGKRNTTLVAVEVSNDKAGWNFVSWVQDALKALAEKGELMRLGRQGAQRRAHIYVTATAIDLGNRARATAP